MDEESGKIVPTDGRGKKRNQIATPLSKRRQKPHESIECSFYGATYLLDNIGNKLGITKDLKQCFPDKYKQILSVAYYLILEDNNPLFRFEKWHALHKHPYSKDITSQRSSELFASISEDAKENFFRLQGRRRVEKEFWAYDTTTVSSYSGGHLKNLV